MTGEQIRAARKNKGWTQAQLAEAAGITQSMLSMVESGAAEPSSGTLRRIATALGLEVQVRLIDPNALRAATSSTNEPVVAALEGVA
jgi:transcriptional regulator with XRE-family HTH domain